MKKKRGRSRICVLILLILLAVFEGDFFLHAANESENENKIDITVPREIEEYLPEDLWDTDASEIYKAFDFNFFMKTGLKILAVAVPEATKSFAILLGLLIIAACLRALRDTITQSALKTVVELVGMLCICTAVFAVTENVFTLADSFITSLSSFMAVVTPTMTALMLAGGGVTSAAVMTGVVSSALSILELICSGVLFPLIRISLALSAVSSVFGHTGIGGVTPIIKKIIAYIFGFVTMCLSAVVAFQGILSKSADSLAMKGVKFAVGSFIPIVGGAVNEALSTIAGGIGVIRSATGVVGAIAVCLIAALPVIKILVHKMFLEILSACSAVLGLGSEGKLISDMASFLGYVAAIMAISAVFFILTLSLMASSGI